MLTRSKTSYRYGMALAMVLGADGLLLLVGEGLLPLMAAGFLQAGAVFVIYATTEVTARRWGAAAFGAALVVLVVAAAWGEGEGSKALVSSMGVVLSLVLAVSLLRAITLQPMIDSRTILGAITVYAVIGLLFAELHQVAAVLSSGTYFNGAGEPTNTDFVYFSYVTQATVGYGDITPLTKVGRSLAITQAMAGQLYLVTVVALLVSKFGSRRDSPR